MHNPGRRRPSMKHRGSPVGFVLVAMLVTATAPAWARPDRLGTVKVPTSCGWSSRRDVEPQAQRRRLLEKPFTIGRAGPHAEERRRNAWLEAILDREGDHFKRGRISPRRRSRRAMPRCCRWPARPSARTRSDGNAPEREASWSGCGASSPPAVQGDVRPPDLSLARAMASSSVRSRNSSRRSST